MPAPASRISSPSPRGVVLAAAAALAGCAYLAVSTPAFAAGQALASRVEREDPVTRVWLTTSQPPKHRAFFLREPLRFVVDLDGVAFGPEIKALPGRLGNADPLVERIRVAVNRPGVVRVVFDLRAPATSSIAVLPASGGGHQLRVDLRPRAGGVPTTVVAAATPPATAASAPPAAPTPPAAEDSPPSATAPTPPVAVTRAPDPNPPVGLPPTQNVDEKIPPDDNWARSIDLRRPGESDAVLFVPPPAMPDQVPAPYPATPRISTSVPDRWRLVDQVGLVNQRWYDPYNPNTLKGDRPIIGNDIFFALNLVSDTVFEARSLPTPIAQVGLRPDANDQFGRGRQSTFNQNLIFSAALLKGNTTFKPPEWEVRVVPVVNLNYSRAQEVRALRIDPQAGISRRDGVVTLQEAFVDYEYNIASVNYDFDDIRVGIQPYISDFRGLVFQDVPVGVRFFGTRGSSRYQYNVAWFRRLEKDTNSGLNDLSSAPRQDDVFLASLFRQDTFVLGFTLQGTVLHNINRERGANYYDRNGFLVRPAVFGDSRPRGYRVTYLGLSGDGHFDRWNVTASAYLAAGRDERNPFSGQPARIQAGYLVGELSRDFDWIRVRGTGIYATPDRDPYDSKETGFDAILENPQIAGADTTFWIRQAVPLIGGGGVALSGRNALLPSLRSSKDQGQSNFINPGLYLTGLGADLDVTPKLRLVGNVNRLWFADTAVLQQLRSLAPISRNIGTTVSGALQYRPLLNQNIVVSLSGSVLFPGLGFRQLFLEDSRQLYSVLLNVLLTY